MAETVQRLSGAKRLNIFGIRHLSPASAHHLLEYLERLRPKCVLIEGPSDANGLIPHIAGSGVQTPIALLAYTAQSPVRTVLYPLAEYSPEYQAILWAFKNGAEVRFIDLPAAAIIRYDGQKAREETMEENPAADYYKIQARFYEGAAKIDGEPDYDSFWERNFEHCGHTDAFTQRIGALSQSMRDCLEDSQWQSDKGGAGYNLVREACMKRNIEQAATDGFDAGEIVIVTGAYHVEGLLGDTQTMTDAEFDSLPKTEVKMTLMPYSYYRLSSQSGYGAGNKAPAYFQLLWEHMRSGVLERLAPTYLSMLGEITRSAGNYNSTASVIEAVRLCESLALMHGGVYPTLKDLHDAAVCLLGGGELAAVSEAFARADVGKAIGSLPEGVVQTPVQDDMNRQLKRLKLEKYKTVVAQDIALDLRENRSVKSSEAAYIDLNRSIFFNRLALLNIHFAQFVEQNGASAWSEKWALRWTPEVEIEIVEATLKGETIENAAAFSLKERFEASNSVLEVAALMRVAFACHLLSETPNGLSRLQALCVDGSNFVEIASACREISNTILFRDVRNVDTSPLIPILQQLFLRAALILFDGAVCDDEAAKNFAAGIDSMHLVSQEQFEHVNDALWLQKLREVADSDSRNAKISGVATALLMERGEITDEDLKREVSRRLSYGVPGDLAALWFEGLSARNRYVLLSRVGIWKQLDDYLDALDENEFRRSLVFLRRAFGAFEPREKNSVIEILADYWNVDAGSAAEFLQEELSDEEQEALSGINDFDFDGL